MKAYFFKASIFVFALVVVFLQGISQPIPSPGTNFEICPGNTNAPSHITISFNFGSNNPSNYVITEPAGCSIVSNMLGGSAIMQFSDKREAHSFKVYSTSLGQSVGTYTYTKIKTLDGVKGTFPVPVPIPPPPSYDDILTSTSVGRCLTTTFRYNSPPVYYKDASGTNFGQLPMNLYEWVAPKGWKVNNTISDGTTPIIGSIFADITPDPLTTGEFKIRAMNNCNPDQLTRSKWFNVYIDRPAFNLTVAADKASIGCGSQPLVTFTAQGTSGITCISNYTWSIGAGWLLDNGTPAPATYSTGTNNTVSLKPDCGKALGNVSVKITAIGVNYSSNNAASMPISQTSYTIAGYSSICSGSSSFSINPAIPCNATIAWSALPAGIVTPTTTTSVTPTFTLASYGYTTLSAAITACGTALPVITKPIHTGPYLSSEFILSGNNNAPYFCANQTISFGVSGTSTAYGATASNSIWSLPTGWSTVYYGGSYLAIKSPAIPQPTTSISVSFQENCGTNYTLSRFLAYTPNSCNTIDPRYTYSPNPAPTTLTVAVATAYLGSAWIRKIELVRSSTGASVYFQDYSFGNVTSTSINVTGFAPGSYTLRVYDGSNWSSYSILH